MLLVRRLFGPRVFSPLYRAQLAWRLPTLTRLALRLLRDPRVPRPAKAATLGALGLVLSPLNLPGWVPVVGQAADLLVIATVLDVFIRSAPRAVVQEHVAALGPRPVHSLIRCLRPDTARRGVRRAPDPGHVGSRPA